MDNDMLTPETASITISSERLTSGNEFLDIIKCSSCSQINSKPNFFNCCEQLVCQKCTDDWMSMLKSCPNCRNANYKIENLNKYHQKIIDSLKFNCAFTNLNCSKTDLTFLELIKHEDYCEFNPNKKLKCEKCDIIYKHDDNKEHSCVDELKKLLKAFDKETELLKKMMKAFEKDREELTKYKRENESLKNEILNLNTIIQESNTSINNQQHNWNK
jgi:hypothetical protein